MNQVIRRLSDLVFPLAPWFGLVMVFGVPWSHAFFYIGLVGMLGCLLASPTHYRDVLQTLKHPVVWLSLSLLAFISLGFFYTDASATMAVHDLKKYRKLLLVPVFVALYPDVRWAKRVLMAYAAGVVVLMIPTLVDGSGWAWASERLAGSRDASYSPQSLVHWRNHIVHGFHAAILFVICVSTVLLRQSRYRWLAAVLAALAVVDIFFFIHGRAALISLLLVCLAWALSYGSARLRAGMAIAVVLVSISSYAYNDKIRERIDSVVSEGTGFLVHQQYETSGGIRLFYWRMSLDLFRQSPVWGMGPGSFRQHLEAPDNVLREQPHRHAHNEYMTLSSQHGLIGLLIFFALVGQAVRATRTQPDRWLRRILGLGLLVFMLNAMTDSSLHNESEGWTFVIFVSLAAASLAATQGVVVQRAKEQALA